MVSTVLSDLPNPTIANNGKSSDMAKTKSVVAPVAQLYPKKL
jgi:hypothetical protein